MALGAESLVQLWGRPLLADDRGGDDPLATLRLDRVCTDSRGDLKGALFVPLVGERFDGHDFLEQALAGGGAAAAVASPARIPAERARRIVEHTGRPLWLVSDTLAAYQELARIWRRLLAVPVVAVTGSAGKTTTRELIRAVLSPLGAVVASRGNDNNDIGGPLTLLRAGPGTAAVVVEMGMRGLGEIERLSRCAEPDVAVITNIGTAHIGRLGSRGAIARAKCEITSALRPGGCLVIPAGDPLLEATLAQGWQGRVVRVALADERSSLDPSCPAPDRLGRLDAAGDSLRWLDHDGAAVAAAPAAIALPLPGRHNARNLLLALAVAEECGVDLARLSDLAVDLPGGRSHRRSIGSIEILDETYNASPEAVLAALDLLAGLPGRHFAVLGTMLELGERSLELHRRVGEKAAAVGLEGLVVVDAGAEGVAMAAGAAGVPRLTRVDNPEGALPSLLEWLQPQDRLLLKGSRGVALERLLPLLQAALEPAGEGDPAPPE